MEKSDIFQTLLLIARPAAGKSEIIHFLRKLDATVREKDYHLGSLNIIDDFPFLWRWFEEDDLLEKMGYQRIYTDAQGYFKNTYLWDLLIQMINLEYEKSQRDAAKTDGNTTIIEFSRGKEHGGYQQALPQLSPAILDQLAILYVDVPWEESLRKNRIRFNPDKPDSILEHSLPDEKLEKLYRDCDFHEMASGQVGKIQINGYQIPYAVFSNPDDVTTLMGAELGCRLKSSLDDLWEAKHAIN